MDIKEALEKLQKREKIDLISLIRKFKKEGIETFAITKLEIIETILAELENSKKETQQVLSDYQELGKDYYHLECELEKKEKIIDELVKTTVKLRETSNEDCFIPRTYRDIDECIRTTCEKCLKEYFKKKVEEDFNEGD